MKPIKLLSIIAPVYNEQGCLQEFYFRTIKAMEASGIEFELIFVNDGSKDDSELLLTQFAEKDKRVKVLNFSRNFGHQLAVTAGMDYASGDAVVIIDADLQDPPEVISRLLEKRNEGYEVVNALRKSRQDGFLKKFTAELFYKFLNSLLTNKIPENVGDFRLLDSRPLEVLKMMREKDRYIRGMTTWIGFKQTFVEFDRDKRFAGKTHYSLRKMLDLGMNGIFSFSDLPMKAAHFMTFAFFVLSVVTAVYAILMRIAGLNVPGWTSQVLITLIVGVVEMAVLSIISEYVGRIYRQTQGRPLYIIGNTLNTEAKSGKNSERG